MRVRIDDNNNYKVKKAAARNLRSIPQEVNYALDQYYVPRPKRKAK